MLYILNKILILLILNTVHSFYIDILNLLLYALGEIPVAFLKHWLKEETDENPQASAIFSMLSLRVESNALALSMRRYIMYSCGVAP